MSSTAVADTAAMNFLEAADFAAGVEEMSRNLEFLQVVAAGAVDRTRREAQAQAAARAGSGSGAAIGWATGWGEATAEEGPAKEYPVPDPADDGCEPVKFFV